MDGLDEPVAQKDNDFFLDHDATGRRNVNGSLFLDEDFFTVRFRILRVVHIAVSQGDHKQPDLMVIARSEIRDVPA